MTDLSNTIPANQLVNSLPSVLAACGSAQPFSGLCLTTNARVPIGTIPSFPSDTAVEDFFGANSAEFNISERYFAGYEGATQLPGAMLFAQYNENDVAAYVRGGNAAAALTIPQLQAITGTLTIVVDGVSRTNSSVNLSSDTSYSAAASTIQTAINTSLPTEASVTGAIAPETFSVTGSISGSELTVTAVASGTVVAGAGISGTGIASGTFVTGQISGTAGGIGVYSVNQAQTVPSTTVSGAYGELTVSAVGSGVLAIGQTLSGSGVTAGTQITGLISGTGGTGTYVVTPSQTVGSESLTASATAVAVTFDSVSGAFVITSGNKGAASTIAFPTGSVAAPLLLTQATGAVLSQGANAANPNAFMSTLIGVSQAWVTFFLAFDPDFGAGNTQKEAFATWNGLQNDRFVFACWDTDITPTESTDASASLGQLLEASETDGTILVYQPSDLYGAAFVAGMIASINFNEPNGRITLAYKTQSGLVPGVTSGTVAQNLIANHYNFVGIYAEPAEEWTWLQTGSISGRWDWADSYVNQIWLNSQFRTALLTLLGNVGSIPYNQAGYDLIENALMDPINAGLLFGAFRAGVTLSAAQAQEVNIAAGANIATTLSQRGWYLQILDASPQVRQARGTPPINFWYMDGESVQQITVASIALQ